MTPQPEWQYIREQFPILREKVNGNPLVYLDNAATTQKPKCVIDTITDLYTHKNSNIHRGVHHLSNLCTDLYEQARHTIASFINAQDDEIIFTRGTTESLNLLAYSFGETFLKEGDEIIITLMDHHANIVPWQMLCARKKLTLRVAPIDDNGDLILNEFFKLINNNTKLISIPHISNVTGAINPIKTIIDHAHQYNIPVCIDAAQSVAHTKIDVKELDCDFLCFSGHKIYGPTGIGVLYGKKQWLEQLVPYQGGGSMIDKVTIEQTTFLPAPLRFEAGTPNYVGAIALAEAIRFLENIDMFWVNTHDKSYTADLRLCLSQVPGVRIIGNPEKQSTTMSFLLGNAHPLDVGMLLDKMGVAVRTGHHCAQPLMERFGIKGTVRVSLAIYNNHDDLLALRDALFRIAKMLG